MNILSTYSDTFTSRDNESTSNMSSVAKNDNKRVTNDENANSDIGIEHVNNDSKRSN